MDRTIARLNIEHFQRLLGTEKNLSKREMLQRLLAEEQAKLSALDANDPQRQKPGS